MATSEELLNKMLENTNDARESITASNEARAEAIELIDLARNMLNQNNIASGTASDAKDISLNAIEISEEAHDMAEDALYHATQADAQSTDAKAQATSANRNSQNALAIAQEAKGQAQDASNVASASKVQSAQAEVNSTQAKTDATIALNTANTALQRADSALSKSTNAELEASHASQVATDCDARLSALEIHTAEGLENLLEIANTQAGNITNQQISIDGINAKNIAQDTAIKLLQDNYATKAEVEDKVANLVDSAPEALDTLQELAEALCNDPNFATTIANQLGQKASKDELAQVRALATGAQSSADKASGAIPQASTTTPKAAATSASAGNENKWARGDHVHPVQTNITGNAGTATALQTARTINGTAFNGSQNITTSQWGATRNVGIVNSDGTGTAVTTQVNGSGNVNLKLPAVITANIKGNADTATRAQDADSADSAKRLANTAAIGSANQPVYFTGAGVPQVCTSLNLKANTAGTADSANKLNTSAGNASTPVYFENGIPKAVTSVNVKASNAVNADTATKLATGRTINGTTFDGSQNITTSSWGASRNIGILSSDGSGTAVTTAVNGSASLNLKLPAQIKANIQGNADSATRAQDADSADTAKKLTVTSAIGNASTPVYFNAEGRPAACTSINLKASTATSADQATKATQDANGNNIVNTYATKAGIPQASTTTPKAAASTASVGSETKFARGDHVHPVQTSVSGSSGSCTGNAATATRATTAASADQATKATQDANGNVITTTYATKTELSQKADDSAVVKVNGDQHINGTKTFTGTVKSRSTNIQSVNQLTDTAFKGSQSNGRYADISYQDKDSTEIGRLGFRKYADGSNSIRMLLHNTAPGGSDVELGISQQSTGDPYCYATPPEDPNDHSRAIATTSWVRNAEGNTNMHAKSAGQVICRADEGTYADPVIVMGDGNKRAGGIRVFNQDGANQIVLGACNENNEAPTGLVVTNTAGALSARINGSMTANSFTGNLNGNATSATMAIQDGSGNNISGTYLAKDAASGLYVTKSEAESAYASKSEIAQMSSQAYDEEVKQSTNNNSVPFKDYRYGSIPDEYVFSSCVTSSLKVNGLLFNWMRISTNQIPMNTSPSMFVFFFRTPFKNTNYIVHQALSSLHGEAGYMTLVPYGRHATFLVLNGWVQLDREHSYPNNLEKMNIPAGSGWCIEILAIGEAAD